MRPTVTAIAAWFGSDRTVAERYAKSLKGCRWVGVPFGGGMSIVPHLDAPTIVVGDLHCHIVNLARVVADGRYGPKLYRRLRRLPFHPVTLRAAQQWCEDAANDATQLIYRPLDDAHLIAAEAYFVACWMGRSGNAGTDKEFTGNLSVRWNANGGDSNRRYRSAVSSLIAWRRSLQRCNFVVKDCFDFLDECKDSQGHGLYIDPPWFDDGERYRHTFSEDDHERLAKVLRGFTKARVVVRLGVHAETERLYPTDAWEWTEIKSRTQGNTAKDEVMLVRRNANKQPELFA